MNSEQTSESQTSPQQLVQVNEHAERLLERVELLWLAICGTLADRGRKGKGQQAGRAVGRVSACGGGV